MSEQQTPAASSPAEVEDVFQGQNVSLDEFSRYRDHGELPDRFKPAEEAESVPADAPEETAESEADEAESEPESDPEEAQEQPQKGSGAERRIKQLLAKQKELERKLSEVAKPDVKPDSPPAQTAQHARPKPTAEDKDKDGNLKYATYEDFVEELADWKAEQRIVQAKREQIEQDAQKALKAKLDESRQRYEDADEVIFPAAQAIRDAQMPSVVKQVFGDSDVFTDLCYVVGSDPDELTRFISLAQTNPRAAIAKVFEYERGIKEELSGQKEPEGKNAPEPKRTSAPPPPKPVSGTSRGAFDVSDEGISNEEWMRKRNAALDRRKT